ncbi:MAG TPA: glycosyltransferase family 2 protein [Thermoanaerobaculia bacterium]|nr:glycosyltransferase family 2 protein [Thermoanaerobaculia bacterium]
MSPQPSIVVLSWMRSDAWTLRRFLEVTSVFADRIVIADEGATDNSRQICAEFDKVTVVDHRPDLYDEGARQELLLRTARELVPLPRILLALDVDEILAANAMGSRGWQAMLGALPGTVLFFEKPRLYLSTASCARGASDFAAGFVDDGEAEHHPRPIYSPRLPMPAGAPHLTAGDIKFLHYALVRPEAQKAKARMYAALENVMGTRSLYQRRRAYWSRRVLRPAGPLEATPREWFAAWERRGIDMDTIRDVQPYWQDIVTLDLLLKYGSRRFWLDDLWGKDWNRFIVQLGRLARVDPPPLGLRLMVDVAQRVVEWAR